MDKKNLDWQPGGNGENMVRNLSDFGYLSFNPAASRTTEYSDELDGLFTREEFDEAMRYVEKLGLDLSQGPPEETALVDDRDFTELVFFILKGDFRVEFKDATTWAEAKAVYDKLAPKHRSDWTTNVIDEKEEAAHEED